MKLLILSDLHLEFGNTFVPPAEGYDVAIIAGDITVPAAKAVYWAKRPSTFRSAKGVIYVPGNHEFYGSVLQPVTAEMKRVAQGSKVHALDCGEVVIDGVRFLGCTLWTDFALRIDSHNGLVADVPRSMDVAQRQMLDFRRIRTEAHTENVAASTTPPRALTPEDALELHQAHRQWLAGKLAEPFKGPTVVVTHHAPHRQSLAARYADDWCSGAFVSELPDEFFNVPALWIHGHTHTSFDYRVGNCRVVSNPRGYLLGPKERTPENENFDPALVVEI